MIYALLPNVREPTHMSLRESLRRVRNIDKSLDVTTAVRYKGGISAEQRVRCTGNKRFLRCRQFSNPGDRSTACVNQPVAQTRSKLQRRKIWDCLGARAPNMGVEYTFMPFMRQAGIYIVDHTENALA